ncbi:MAG: DMT family transporter [Clostridiales bacterium]|nr:DMT family transporter [Clostridiales bacterium]MDY5513751.1 DMT family transporter [Candidatus Ventricola sp.]
MKKNKTLLVFLAVVGVSVSGPMVKWSLACGASPVMVAFGRMLLSALLLLFPAIKSGELVVVLRAPRRQLGLACAAALLLALHYTAWMTSMSFSSTFVATALVCTQPLFVAALSGILLHEPIKREAIPGAIVAIIGAAAIGLLSMGGEQGSLLGDALALVGAIFIAGHWLCGRAARKNLPAIGYMTFVYCVTALCLLVISPFTGGFQVTLPSLGGIVVLAVVCTLGGHALMTYLLGFVSADVVSFALLGEPIGAAVWALLLFGEQVTLPLLIGGLTVIVGLAMYTWGEMQAAKKEAAAKQG